MQRCIMATLCIVGLFSGGCSVIVGTGGGGHDGRHDRPVVRGNDTVTLAEIDAAADLTFDNGKEKTFTGIASRPYLSAQAQVYLVKKAMGSLTFDNAKQNVLLALVNNPYFLAEGKQAVLENLNALTFDNNKQTVLEAINKRGYVPSEPELQRRMEHPHPLQEPQEDGAVEMETMVEMETSYLHQL